MDQAALAALNPGHAAQDETGEEPPATVAAFDSPIGNLSTVRRDAEDLLAPSAWDGEPAVEIIEQGQHQLAALAAHLDGIGTHQRAFVAGRIVEHRQLTPVVATRGRR